MKSYLIAIIAFLIGFFGIILSQYQQIKSNRVKNNQISVVGNQPTLALSPPAQAVTGYITVFSGTAKKFSRGETEYKEVASDEKVLQGESVATELRSSAFVAFQGYVDTRLAEFSEVAFVNVAPPDFLMQQKLGSVEYTIIRPVSLRALHALISMQPGSATVQLLESQIIISVQTGSAKVAIVDLDNNTRVYDILPGQKATIDDEVRIVRIK